MAATKTIPLPPGPNGEQRSSEVTHLQYALQYVKFKIQDMVTFFALLPFGVCLSAF
jgi:ATP-dependent DNA helicase 2 subunit 2